MEAHRHTWTVERFAFADDRPIVRQRCSCGAERSVPAWDRSWTPQPRWRLVHDGVLTGRLMESTGPAPAPTSGAIAIDVWSDIACPWCYIGKRNLEAGIADFRADANAMAVRVAFHSFELDPEAPIDFDGTADEYLAARKGIDAVTAHRLHERVTAIAAAAGLRYDFASLRRTRTARAHQLIHHAAQRGLESEAVERLFAAQFTEGRDVGSIDSLTELGADIGLERDELARSLAADEHLGAVRADEQQAAAIGIHGVPFFVLDGHYGLSGAQPPDVFSAALRRVAAERMPTSAV